MASDNVNVNNLKRGMVLNLPEGLFQVLEFLHHKPGKGQAVVRTKLRNLRNDSVLDRTFNSDTKVGMAILDRREMQYLYSDGDDYVFMDSESYEQTHLSAAQIGEDGLRFLKEGVSAAIALHDGRPVSVDLPTTVDLEVTVSDPGLRGDRSSAGTKPATLETGTTIQVPLFVEPGDVVRVDTRNGEYVTRVQK
ncbi:MAG TPA: elongation factor P [Actinomycetota bacterium]|nr:elongation factor P [Actinomycetota bacterium]